MFMNYCRNNTKRGLKFTVRKTQNVPNCIKAPPLKAIGSDRKIQFVFAAEKCTR